MPSFVVTGMKPCFTILGINMFQILNKGTSMPFCDVNHVNHLTPGLTRKRTGGVGFDKVAVVTLYLPLVCGYVIPIVVTFAQS